MTTLYQLAHSPYCIPIRAIFTALEEPLEVVDVPSGDRRQLIELTGGKSYEVPVLVDGERVLCETGPETLNVPRYVSDTFASGRLFPTPLEGLHTLLIRNLENDVEGTTFRLADPEYVASLTDPVDRAMVVRHKERKFGRGCVEAWRAQRPALLEATRTLLEPYAQIVSRTPFLLGDFPIYADFLLYGILGNLTWGGHVRLPGGLSELAEWRLRLEGFRF